MEIISFLLVVLSLIGLADASFITYEDFAHIIPPCIQVAGFNCGAVLTSQWSHIGPLPLSVLGMGFYLTMLLLGSYLLVTKKPHFLAKPLVVLLGFSAFLFSVFLVYLQAVVIKAFCTYCMISATTSTLIFLTTLPLWRKVKLPETTEEAV